MNIVYSNDNSAMKIYGDHSPHPVITETAVVNELGGPENAFHRLKQLQPFWARSKDSEVHPFSMRDLKLTLDNERRGCRYWRWENLNGPKVKESTGYDWVKGYAYCELDGTFVFVDSNNAPTYTVKM